MSTPPEYNPTPADWDKLARLQDEQARLRNECGFGDYREKDWDVGKRVMAAFLLGSPVCIAITFWILFA